MNAQRTPLKDKTCLILDSDIEKARILEGLLTPTGVSILKCLDPSQVGMHLNPTLPDVVVACTELSGLSALSLLKLVRSRMRYTPIVFVHWNHHPAPQDNLIWHGADDLLKESELSALVPLIMVLAQLVR